MDTAETLRLDANKVATEKALPTKDFTSPDGSIKTFTTEKAAQFFIDANKENKKVSVNGFVPRLDDGAWVLTKTIKEKSPAQLKAIARQAKDAITVYPDRDNLYTAMAKEGGLDKKEAISTWGADPKDYRPSGVFRKPTLRYGGLSIDEMGQRLADHGYLPKDENGKFDVRDFEEAFRNGRDHYTASGHERRAEMSEEQRYQEEQAKYVESAAHLVDDTPEIQSVHPENQHAAVDITEDLADDVFAHKERNNGEIALMRNLGFTEKEIADEIRNQAENQSQAGQSASRPEAARPESRISDGKENQAEPASGEVWTNPGWSPRGEQSSPS